MIGSDLLHLLGPRAPFPSFSSLSVRRIFTSLINKANDFIQGKKRQRLFLLVCCHNQLANESQRGDNIGKAVVVALDRDLQDSRSEQVIGYYDLRAIGSANR